MSAVYTDADVQAAHGALIAEGAAPGSGLHSWRCEYPDMYGPCDCVTETARAVLDAVAPAIAARAKAEALREVAQEHRNSRRSTQEPIWPAQLDLRADEIERTSP